MKTRLRDKGVPFVIGGAFALAAHGHPRFTDDLDVMVLTRSLEPVHQALDPRHYERINEVTFRDIATGLYIDIFPVEDEAQREVFETAGKTELHGARGLRVLTPEGLVLMLLREATQGDPDKTPLRLRDIELLARTHALDWAYLAEWATKMGYEAAYEDLSVPDKPPL